MAASTSLFTLESILPCAVPNDGENSESPAELGRAMRCVSVRHTHALVGASDGTLHHFAAQDSASWAWQASVSISSTGRPVDRVFLLEGVRLAAVLCEHTLSFYTWPALTPVHSGTLPPIRGVLQIALDEAESADDGPFVSLCVVRRHNLLLGLLDHTSWSVVKDIPIPRDAFIAHRHNDCVCLATATEYTLVNLETGTLQPIGLPISQSAQVSSARTRPSILPIPAYDDELPCFLITSHSDSGTLGAFVRADGEPTARLLEWPSHPRAVVADFPYVCALLRNDTIHIHHLPTLTLVEIQPVDPAWEPRFLVSTAPNPHLCASGPGLATQLVSPSPAATARLPPLSCVRTLPPRILLGGKRSLHCLTRRSPGSAWLQCAHAGAWHAAHAHLARNDVRDDEARVACLLHGLHCMQEGLFDQAAPWLVQGHIDPRLLLALWPVFAPKDAAVLPQAAAGFYAALPPTMDALVHAHLAWNYTPDVPLDNVHLCALGAALTNRAEHMLLHVLRASDMTKPDVATALCHLSLQRDPSVPLAEFAPWLETCHVDRVAGLLRDAHRYHALCQLLLQRAQPADSIHLAQQLLDGYLHDAVDGPLSPAVLASYAPRLAPAARLDLGLVLAHHDRACALEVLRDVDFVSVDAAPALSTIQKVDASLTEALLEHVVLSAPRAMPSLHESLLTQYLASPTADEPRTCAKRRQLLACSPVLDVQLVAQLDGRPVEQAILLCKAGRYEEALASLVHAHEFSAAERVCAMGRVLPPEALEEPGWARLAALAPAPLLPPSESQRLRHALAALYMTPSTSSDAFCAPCAHLLHVHASEFALDAVLTAVPAEWPVQALAPFLVRALRTAQHTRRTAHVAKAASLRLSLEAAAQRWHTVRALGGLVEDPR